jgi:hypothetical protein
VSGFFCKLLVAMSSTPTAWSVSVARSFIDTNILVYADDAFDPRKQTSARPAGGSARQPGGRTIDAGASGLVRHRNAQAGSGGARCSPARHAIRTLRTDPAHAGHAARCHEFATEAQPLILGCADRADSECSPLRCALQRGSAGRGKDWQRSHCQSLQVTLVDGKRIASTQPVGLRHTSKLPAPRSMPAVFKGDQEPEAPEQASISLL